MRLLAEEEQLVAEEAGRGAAEGRGGIRGASGTSRYPALHGGCGAAHGG